jgi:outer membrane protein OmpA-like peptidoglycan-associated protein
MRRTIGIVSGICLFSLSVAMRASAQQPMPPPGPAELPPGPAAPPGGYAPGPAPTYPQQPAPPAPAYPAQPPPTDGAPPQGAPAYPPPTATAPAGQPPGGAAVAGSGSVSLGADGAEAAGSATLGDAEGEGAVETSAAEREYRLESLKIQNGIDASTGLFRLYSADSGAVGTFRFSLITSYFSGSGFLCPTCADPNGGPGDASDDATHIGGDVGISATPFSFLEAYFGVHTSASSNSLGSPKLLQVLGDMNLGLKGFMPHQEDSIFSAGGAAEVWLLNGAGAVGIDNASYALRGLATLDLNNRKNKEDRIPLRAHLNLGYLFDNSGNLVNDIEKQRLQRITRIERFGLNINRVDSFSVGLGAEGMFNIVRPFLEWTIDIPVNRQDHICDNATRAAGDLCLGNAAGFSTTPSRLTIGTRVHPFFDGLALLAAIDVGTGATSTFIEEVAPEVPWNLHFGVAYAADIVPHVEIRRVEAKKVAAPEPPKQTHFILGTVVEKGSNTPIADAQVRFDGRALTGMITIADGTFRTGDLDPGTYTFNVSASGYRDGQCTTTIGFAGPAAPAYGAPGGQPAGYTAPAYGQPGAPGAPAYGAATPAGTPGQPGQPFVPGQPGAPGGAVPSATVVCELEAQAKVGNVNGQLRDTETSAAVGGAAVKITDKLGRSLSLTADAAGAFRFENVPPGPVTISAEAAGYLRAVTEVEVKPRGEVSVQIAVTKRPTRANVVVTDKELKLKKEVHFQHDSSQILPDSMGIIEEAADALRSHAEIANVEVQGHTDDSGTPEYNLRLSGERANAVREALILNGVEPNRLTARGYGQEKPLVPNTNDANRAKNRRVQLMIQK